jgi:hypothetical protein
VGRSIALLFWVLLFFVGRSIFSKLFLETFIALAQFAATPHNLCLVILQEFYSPVHRSKFIIGRC